MLVLIAALRSEVMEDLDKVVKSLEDDSWKFTQPQSKPYFFYRSGMLLLFFYFSNQHWFWCRTAGCYCLVPTAYCLLVCVIWHISVPGQACSRFLFYHCYCCFRESIKFNRIIIHTKVFTFLLCGQVKHFL